MVFKQKKIQDCGVNELRHFLPYLSTGHKDPSGRWDNPQLAETVKSRTVKDYHATLLTFFNWIVDEGALITSPMEHIPVPVDGPDFTLMQFLGHTHLAMTARYVTLAQADVENQHRHHPDGRGDRPLGRHSFCDRDRFPGCQAVFWLFDLSRASGKQDGVYFNRTLGIARNSVCWMLEDKEKQSEVENGVQPFSKA